MAAPGTSNTTSWGSARVMTPGTMARVTLDQLIKGRDGLDALVRTDPEDQDAIAWLGTIDFLNREIVRRGGEAFTPPHDDVVSAPARSA